MKLKKLLSFMSQIATQLKVAPPVICGGIPRDSYMKTLSNISDIDIATGDQSVHLIADEVYNKLNHIYDLKMHTSNDGHKSIRFKNIKLDFSSNFIAPNIDQHLATKGILNPTPLQREFFSRDFTCNALIIPADVSKIIDIVGTSKQDINNKVIKTCLSPEASLDDKRVVRAIYLAAKLNFTIDQSIIDFVAKQPEIISTVPDKMLTEKIDKAMEKNPNKTLFYIHKMNLWNYIPMTPALQKFQLAIQTKGLVQ